MNPGRPREPLACSLARILCLVAARIVAPTEDRIRAWAVVRYI